MRIVLFICLANGKVIVMIIIAISLALAKIYIGSASLEYFSYHVKLIKIARIYIEAS